jgi:DNA-binding IclR family transcriptional regulator
LFKAMAGAGPLTSAALADRASVAERYAEEWLAVMAGAGYVEHDADSGSFTLPDEHAQFLADPESEYYLGGLFQGLPAMAAALKLSSLVFRTKKL